MASYCDIIGVRTFAGLTNREDDYTECILNQFIRYSGKPVFSMESATAHPLQSFADLITIDEYKKTKEFINIMTLNVCSWSFDGKDLEIYQEVVAHATEDILGNEKAINKIF